MPCLCGENSAAALLCTHCGTDQRDERFLRPDSAGEARSAKFERSQLGKLNPAPEVSPVDEAKGEVPVMSRELNYISRFWREVFGESKPSQNSAPSRRLGITAPLAVIELISVVFIIARQSQLTVNRTPQKSIGQESHEFGVESGIGLAAQNRSLFLDEDGQCVSAFNYYSGSRNLDFDHNFVGCKAGWNLSKNH